MSSSSSSSGKDDISSIAYVPNDLLAITYGCVVQQLAEDYGDPDTVSSILHTMGRNMGKRMTDEILSKSKAPICTTPSEYVQACASVCNLNFDCCFLFTFILQIGFNTLLKTEARTIPTQSPDIFLIEFDQNPLAENVEVCIIWISSSNVFIFL